MTFVVINLVFSALLIVGAVWLWKRTSKGSSSKESWPGGLDEYTLLSLSVPKNNTAKPEAAEQFFAALHGIFREGATEQPRISLEIVSRRQSITFFVYVPANLKDFVVSQIFAQYPNIEIKEIGPEEDYVTLPEEKRFVATELTLKRPTAFPIKTFLNFEVDPLATTTGVLSSLTGDEEVWIQTIVRPADDDWQDLGRDEVKNLKEPPKKPKGVTELLVNESKELFVGFFKQIISPEGGGEEKKEDKKDNELGGPEQQAIKAIEEKITKLGFEANVRILAAASEEHVAKAKLEQVVGAYKQFNTLNLNAFIVKDMVTDRSVLDLFKHRAMGDRDIILNITELATLYHFPSETVSTPTIAWAGAKKGEPPSNLPVLGSVPADDLTVLAQTNFRNNITKFGIKRHDRRLHAYIIGKTGTGKSTFIENMIYDDIREGRGVAVVDPHGELIDHVLAFLPADRIPDVVYFNPADHEFPVGFNVLENFDNNPEMKNVIASGVVGIFKKIFGESWGPRLEYILRNSILAVLEYPNSTLLSVMRILTDNSYRRLVINEVKDPVIRDFFVNEYEKYEPKFRQEAIAPIQNKVGQFLSSSTIRNIVGQPKSTMRMDEVMNNGKILLADLSTGKIGEDNSALLGSMLVTKIQLAAMGRTRIAEADRRDFYLYVDEFQNFATDSFATILSEARKYRLNLVMVNQYIAQMPETVRDAVFGNVGTMVSFRVGSNDAEAMKSEFEPVFDVNDLVNLPNRQIYIKMAIDGVTAPAFSANTLPPPADKTDVVSQVVESSREQFSMSKTDVEDYIAEWSAPIDLSAVEAGKAAGEGSTVTLAGPGNVTPQDKGFANAEPTNVAKKPEQETTPSLPKGSKIEILKDRFSRNWYAVTGSGELKNEPDGQVENDVDPSPVEQVRDVVVTPPVREGVIAEETAPIIEKHIAQEIGESEQKKAGGDDWSRGDIEQSAQDRLITWDQAETLGLTNESKATSKPTDSGLQPIDEL
ncbi:MAG: type IV secretion system DNA-binding domain-containing protein [Candidatus Berkelbacteria bacterium]|nr:MAG: type IV secretion system DNA-binding domain-containing protein [Candidatus Berkelbacteria bacterium]QQG51424.1 MAG: type IV secretion system DNA-binding domain-containing protein [Candidatus Berkelbacteria bacterium]